MRPCVVDRCIIGVIVQWNRHDLSKIRVIIARTLWRFNPQRFNRKNLFYKSRGIKRKIVRASSKYRFLDDACTLASILLLVFSHSRRRRLLCQTIPCGGPFKEFTKIDVSIQPNHTLYHLFQSRILQGCRWIIFWKNSMIIEWPQEPQTFVRKF